jgi:hypothetical protein
MRAVLFILILAVVVVIIAIATGFLDISQTREARAPDIDATQSGVSARGGQAPAFDVETGSIAIGAREQNVTVPVPRVEVRPPESNQQAAASNSQQ